jgi:hypothetical protein
LDEVLLLVEHFELDGIASSIGRDKLKQKVSFAIASFDIFEVVLSFADHLFVVIVLHSDLCEGAVTLHLKYS